MSWSLAWKECWHQQTAVYGLTSELWRTATWVMKSIKFQTPKQPYSTLWYFHLLKTNIWFHWFNVQMKQAKKKNDWKRSREQLVKRGPKMRSSGWPGLWHFNQWNMASFRVLNIFDSWVLVMWKRSIMHDGIEKEECKQMMSVDVVWYTGYLVLREGKKTSNTISVLFVCCCDFWTPIGHSHRHIIVCSPQWRTTLEENY